MEPGRGKSPASLCVLSDALYNSLYFSATRYSTPRTYGYIYAPRLVARSVAKMAGLAWSTSLGDDIFVGLSVLQADPGRSIKM